MKQGRLVLNRKACDKGVLIRTKGGEEILVGVVETYKNGAKLSFAADKSVLILREELLERDPPR